MSKALGSGVRLGLAGPFLLLIWRLVRRAKLRFLRTLATLRRPYRPAKPRPGQPSRLHPLPRHQGWLRFLIPDTSVFASQLTHCINQPDMMALLEADPRLGRILRPLCFALYIRPNQVPCLYAKPAPSPAPDAPQAAPVAGLPPGHFQPDVARPEPFAPPPAALPPQATPPPATVFRSATQQEPAALARRSSAHAQRAPPTFARPHLKPKFPLSLHARL